MIKRYMPVVILVAAGVVILLTAIAIHKPIRLVSHGLMPGFSVDDMIKMSDLIVIGEVDKKLPSNWLGPEEIDLIKASPDDVAQARGLFTDSLISINQILKGVHHDSVVRVRSFIGETPKVIWVNDDEPTFIADKAYLLFLVEDFGPTASVDPGDFIAVGGTQGVYEIVNGNAISAYGEWELDELISYIEKSLSRSQ